MYNDSIHLSEKYIVYIVLRKALNYGPLISYRLTNLIHSFIHAFKNSYPAVQWQ